MSGARAGAALRLYGDAGTAAMVPHLLLHELGAPFEWVAVDRAAEAHKAPAYLRLNPNGLLPTLVDARGAEPIVLWETAAIVQHLADTHAAPALLPPLGSAERAHALKWLAWLSATLQPALLAFFYPERWVDAGNAAGAAQVRAHAQARVGALLGLLDAHLAAHGGPWLLGAGHGALDAYGFTLCRWTRGFASHPARGFAAIGPWLGRVLERPATRATLAAEGHAAPFV
jgi:glutathione S-transferase